MNSLRLVPVGLVAFLFIAPIATSIRADDQPVYKKGMVATVNPYATDIALKVLKSGGNAVDAAIAAGLTLGVVDTHNSGIGGGCFILIRTSAGELIAIDGREMAPAAATRDMYIRNGKPDTSISQVGPLASGVPGALAAYDLALKRAGRKKLTELILPAAELAEQGVLIDAKYAGALKAKAKQLARNPAARKVLLKPNGDPYQAGERLVQVDLGRTYRAISREGVRWFYQGPFAKKTAAWMKANGGIMTEKDFANYQAIQRQPVETIYRGYRIIGFPPPSSGGIHVAQILNILEAIPQYQSANDLQKMHLTIEAMKLAFADRAFWLGDSDFAKVPKGLLSKSYAKQLAARIDPSKTTSVLSHGTPPDPETNLFSNRHTTHVATADSEGNWVAMTQTINTSFGAKVMIPQTGVVMNNEMDDFAVAPGVANAFGLLGSEANSVAPGKRPLSSMSPTIILKGNRPVMSVGAAGGPKIITQSLLATVRFLDKELSLKEAIQRPRFHHQWSPDRVLIEKGTSATLIEALKQKGHRVTVSSVVGVSQAIAQDAEGRFTGVSDPRVPGKAAGH